MTLRLQLVLSGAVRSLSKDGEAEGLRVVGYV